MAMSTRVKAQVISEVDQQGLAAMERITQVIRSADSISAPTAGASAASMTLVVPTPALSPTIFDVAASALRIQEGAAAAVAITSSDVVVTGTNFRNLSRSGTPGTVQVSFTISYNNPGGQSHYSYQKTFTSTISLR